MDKDEMKNRISLALKDPILQQGFEIICRENAELKANIGSSIDCEKAQKNGELCLGYGGNKDEPCERCKNCIKCESGYYQLGETGKDDLLTKAKEILRDFVALDKDMDWNLQLAYDAEQFLSEVKK